MAFIEIPMETDSPNFSFRCELDGTVYAFHFRYNSRATGWAMDFKTGSGQRILSGVIVRLGVDLFAPYSGGLMPGGNLFAINYSNLYQEADRDNFGKDVKLIYKEAL